MHNFDRKSFRTGSDRVAVGLDEFLSQASVDKSALFELPGDTLQAIGLHLQQLGQGGSLHAGYVQLSLPHIGWYRVALEDGHGVKPCYAQEPGTSPEMIGPRSTSMYPPGTAVLVQLFRAPQAHFGIIMGALPRLVRDGNNSMSDEISQGSKAGFRQTEYYQAYIRNLKDSGGAANFSSSRPMDQTVFDYGVMAETGIGLHIDPFYAFLRVDEACGLFLHYADQHAVLAGYNYDFCSAIALAEHRNDNGELYTYYGEAAYPHEAMGTFSFDKATSRNNDPTAVQFELPEGISEPVHNSQMPFHRYREWGGYLGQGRIREMCLPPAQAEYWNFETNTELVGVFREQIAWNGEYALTSAKAITLAKKTLIPVAVRQALPNADTDEADTNANYKYSGYYGGADDTPAHKLDEPALQGEHGDRLSGSVVLDRLYVTTNWHNLHAFDYHSQDFYLPDEAELPLQTDQLPLDFASLENGMWLSKPEPVTLRVDHRHVVKLYQLLSMLSFEDDGTVILQGGHGEQIKFDGGNIVLGAPGHILCQPGKNVVLLAGDDVILRANHSIDITANQNDVRIKADVNMHMLAGNSGAGGMLLESRSIGTGQSFTTDGGEEVRSSGVLIKAARSVASILAGEVYISTGVSGRNNNDVTYGPITLDAGHGAADVTITAHNLTNYLHSGRVSNVFLTNGEISSVTTNLDNAMFIDGQLGVTGTLRVNSFAYFGGHVQLSDGHFASPQGGQVGVVRSPAFIQAELDEVNFYLKDEGDRLTEVYETQITDRYYGQQKIGNRDYQPWISFSYRTESDYGTSNFSLPATHWQNMAEAQGAGAIWAERTVAYGPNQTTQMPWPGKRQWAELETLLTLPPDSFQQYDIRNGRAQARTSERYGTPQRGPFKTRKPNEAYKVIIQ